VCSTRLPPVPLSCNDSGQVVHTRASVTKQSNSVLAKGRRCSASGMVAAGLAQTNGNLLLGLWQYHVKAECLETRTSAGCIASISCSTGPQKLCMRLSDWSISSVLIYHLKYCAVSTFIVSRYVTLTDGSSFVGGDKGVWAKLPPGSRGRAPSKEFGARPPKAGHFFILNSQFEL